MEKKLTRVEYAQKNFIWASLVVIITSIMPFIVRTFIIRCWGMEYVGISALFGSIINVINISQLGMGEAIVYSMYKPMAEGNTEKVNQLLNLYNRIYRGLGIFIFLMGILMIPFLKYLIKGTYPNEINIVIVYIILIIDSSCGYLIFPYSESVFRTTQSMFIIKKYNAFVLMLMYLSQILIIWMDKSYYFYVMTLPIGTVAIQIANRVVQKKKYPDFYPRGNVQKEFFQDFFQRIVGMAIRKIRKSIRGSIDSVIISAFIGIVTVAKYQNYYLVMMIPDLFFGSIRGAILQGFGNSVAVESVEKNYEIISLYAFLTQWLGAWGAACLVCFYNPFMVIWAGSDSIFAFPTVVLFSTYFYVQNLTYVTELLRNATGVWWKGKWIPIIESITNLLLDIVLVRRLGVNGIILATIISIVIINIPFETVNVYKEYFKKNPRKELNEYFINFVQTFVIVGITYMTSELFRGGFVGDVIKKSLLCIVFPNLMWIAFHFRDDRVWWLLSAMKAWIGKKVKVRRHR